MSFRHRFVIPTNQDVGASRVKGRSALLASASRKHNTPLKRPQPPGEHPCTYLCGNSLGLLPQPAEALVQQEFRVWASRQAPHFISSKRVLTVFFFLYFFSTVRRAVQGHHDHPHGREWMNITDHVNPLLAELLGREVQQTPCGASP
jgi:kynureninase